jgi:hypothetical protein
LGVGMGNYTEPATSIFTRKTSLGELDCKVYVEYIKGKPFEDIYTNYKGTIVSLKNNEGYINQEDLPDNEIDGIIKEGILTYNL